MLSRENRRALLSFTQKHKGTCYFPHDTDFAGNGESELNAPLIINDLRLKFSFFFLNGILIYAFYQQMGNISALSKYSILYIVKIKLSKIKMSKNHIPYMLASCKDRYLDINGQNYFKFLARTGWTLQNSVFFYVWRVI